MGELAEMVEIVSCHGAWATGHHHGPDAAELTAYEWLDEGFTPFAASEWLAAGCFRVESAASLRDAGLTPEQCSVLAASGPLAGREKIGYAVSNGDMSVEVARREIGGAS